MRETNKETKDRDDSHPMQNIHFRLARFTCNIGYNDKENNRRHECDSHNGIDIVCCNICLKNSLIQLPCAIKNRKIFWKIVLFEYDLQLSTRAASAYIKGKH